MAIDGLRLKVRKQDFIEKINAIDTKSQQLADVISKYRDIKPNLDQFIESTDSTYEEWCQQIDTYIDAAGRARAALKETRDSLQKTVDQMDDFGTQLKSTISEAVEATKSTVEAAINVAPLL